VPCCNAGSTSPSESGTPVAPIRVICSVWNAEARTRSFLPLKSASVRVGARMANPVGPVRKKARAIRPLAEADREKWLG